MKDVSSDVTAMAAALQTVGSFRQGRQRQWKGRRIRPLQASRWR